MNTCLCYAVQGQPAAAASAVGWAAFLTLRELYPADTAVLNVVIRNYALLLRAIFLNPVALFQGVAWGSQVSSSLLAARQGDGSLNPSKDAFVVRCLLLYLH